MTSVRIFAPPATAIDDPYHDPVKAHLEQEIRTLNIALETLGHVLSCAIRRLVELGEGDGIDSVVFPRERVTRMMEVHPHVTVSETSAGDTRARLQEQNPDPISIEG